VSTLAGTAGQRGSTDGTGAAARFDSPQGVVLDGAGNLYVADTDNHTIRKVVVAMGEVSTLAGTAGQSDSKDDIGAAARFNFPSGIASDGAGNLYVADTNNQTIRKVVIASGAVSTFAGVAGIARVWPGPLPAELSFPAAVAVTASSDVVVLAENSVLIIR